MYQLFNRLYTWKTYTSSFFLIRTNVIRYFTWLLWYILLVEEGGLHDLHVLGTDSHTLGEAMGGRLLLHLLLVSLT